MPSGLMRKLNAMKPGAPSVKQTEMRALIHRVHRVPAQEGLFSISHSALRRLGYNGREFDVRRALFLDTETTGLSGGAGTVAFLVGVGYIENSDFVVEQFLMPTYAHEGMLLEKIAALFPRFDSVVHFNGRSFDMPLLESRFTINRMRDRWKELEPLDLLYPSRRLWKIRLVSCRLSNIEERELGIRRENDIPGAEVPQRYFDFLKSGDMTLLNDVIDHNRQDIITLSLLLCRLLNDYGNPEALLVTEDQFSVGKALEKQGEMEQARRMYSLAAAPKPVLSLKGLISEKYAGEANWRLFHLYRRNRAYDKAESILKNMIKRGQMGNLPKIELAKLYEHKLKRTDEALTIARSLLSVCRAEEREALEKRIKRLELKNQS